MNNKKVLLAGATGYLGSYIAGQLLAEGYSTRLLVRKKNRVPFDPLPFEIVEAEVTWPRTLRGLFEGVDVVISTVGITKQKDGLTYMDVDYRANMNLLEEAKRSGVRKFIYVSALNGEKMKHIKIGEAKESFVAELKKSGMEYCIVRPNGFFSDMTEFLKMAKKGTVNLFGDGSYKMNPIHGKDLAKICVDSIRSTKEEINVGGPEIFSHNEIAELAFRVVNKKAKISYMPEWIRKATLWLARTFTSSKKYGPVEFFFTVLAMDMIAPCYGDQSLAAYFEEVKDKI